MKIARVRLPGEEGPDHRAWWTRLELARFWMLGRWCSSLALPVYASTAVELVRYNTERAGALVRRGEGPLSVQRHPLAHQLLALPSAPSRQAPSRTSSPSRCTSATPASATTWRFPPAWYDLPVYYKGNHRTLRRPRRVCLLAPFQRAAWTTSWNWPASLAKRASIYPWSTPTSTSAATAS